MGREKEGRGTGEFLLDEYRTEDSGSLWAWQALTLLLSLGIFVGSLENPHPQLMQVIPDVRKCILIPAGSFRFLPQPLGIFQDHQPLYAEVLHPTRWSTDRV